MMKSTLFLELTATTLLFTGCVTKYVEVKEPVPSSSMVSVSVSTPAQAPAAAVTSEPTPSVSPVRRPAPSENRDMLRIRVESSGEDESRAFAERVGHGVSGGMALPEFKVVREGACDFLLQMRPSLRLFDRTGDNWLYEADVSLLLTDVRRSRFHATKELSFRGRRSFGREKAVRELVTQTVSGVTAWAIEEVNAVVRQDYASAVLSVQLPETLWERLRGSRDGVAALERVQVAAQEIGRLPGVLLYELQKVDCEHGMALFRIVYARREYPAGLIGPVSAALNGGAMVK